MRVHPAVAAHPATAHASELRASHATRTPAPLAWADGRIIPAEDATVPLTDDGFVRGDAVFDAIPVRRGCTFQLDAHLARLASSAAALDMHVPPLDAVVQQLLAAWGAQDGVLRVFVTRGGLVRGLIGTASWPPAISVAIVDIPWRTCLSGVKTLSYAANQWAARQARALGGDDAIVVDKGLVHELPTGAIVLVRGDHMITPDPARLPILESMTVRALSQVVDLEFGCPTTEDLLTGDEAFALSSTRPVLPIHAILSPDGARVDLPAPGPVSAHARAVLDDTILSHLDHRETPSDVIGHF